jgi:hypothetical protein
LNDLISIRRLAVGVLLVAALAAVPLAGTATAKAKSSCTLLQASEISTILGGEVSKGQSLAGAAGGCSYNVSSASRGNANGIVAVGVQRYSGVISKQEIHLVSQSSIFKALNGVGDQAWFNGQLGSDLVFKKGSAVVQISLTAGKNLDPAATKPMLVALAKKAANRT